jgi:hypothetical protein
MSLATFGDHLLVGYKISTNVTFQMLTKASVPLWPAFTVTDADTILGPMVFDGISLWILLYASKGGSNANMLVRRFSPQSLNPNLNTVEIDTDVDTDKNHFLDVTGVNTTIGQIRPGMIFDGAGVWVSPYAPVGSDFSGKWFRISNVYNR